MLRGPSEVPGLPHTVGSTAPIGVDPAHRFLKNWSRLMKKWLNTYQEMTETSWFSIAQIRNFCLNLVWKSSETYAKPRHIILTYFIEICTGARKSMLSQTKVHRPPAQHLVARCRTSKQKKKIRFLYHNISLLTILQYQLDLSQVNLITETKELLEI